MIIPGDTGHPWRLDKFVEYQHCAVVVDMTVLCEYAKNLTPDDIVMLAWFHSLTYSEVTSILLTNILSYKTIKQSDVEAFWRGYKPVLIFDSARKYAKNMDWFIPLMTTFMSNIKRQPYAWVTKIANRGPDKLLAIQKELNSWKYMGRFSTNLFTDVLTNASLLGLIPMELSFSKYDWKHSSNLTSGLFNVFYQDEKADLFDKKGLITPKDIVFLDEKLEVVLEAVNSKYPDRIYSTATVVDKLCSFRNLFKGNRYGGFHHDRQLGNLIQYQNTLAPEDFVPLQEVYAIRKRLFYPHLLGELNDWAGIRPERKKLWKVHGLTGVESPS